MVACRCPLGDLPVLVASRERGGTQAQAACPASGDVSVPVARRGRAGTPARVGSQAPVGQQVLGAQLVLAVCRAPGGWLPAAGQAEQRDAVGRWGSD